MSKLKTLHPRLKAIDTRRIKPVYGENRRVSGSARVSLKRRIYGMRRMRQTAGVD